MPFFFMRHPWEEGNTRQGKTRLHSQASGKPHEGASLMLDYVGAAHTRQGAYPLHPISLDNTPHLC